MDGAPRCVGWLSPRSRKARPGAPCNSPSTHDGCILGRGSILKAVFDDEEAVLPVESEGTELCLLMDRFREASGVMQKEVMQKMAAASGEGSLQMPIVVQQQEPCAGRRPQPCAERGAQAGGNPRLQQAQKRLLIRAGVGFVGNVLLLLSVMFFHHMHPDFNPHWLRIGGALILFNLVPLLAVEWVNWMGSEARHLGDVGIRSIEPG